MLPYKQSFKSAWESFEVIADVTTGIIVPHCAGKIIRDELSALEIGQKDYSIALHELLKKAQQYTVNVYSNQIQKLGGNGMIYEVIPDSGIYALHEEFYDKDLGLTPEASNENISILSF